MKYNVWANLPDSSIKGSGWSLVARDVSEEQADVYRETFRFPTNVEETERE